MMEEELARHVGSLFAQELKGSFVRTLDSVKIIYNQLWVLTSKEEANYDCFYEFIGIICKLY